MACTAQSKINCPVAAVDTGELIPLLISQISSYDTPDSMSAHKRGQNDQLI